MSQTSTASPTGPVPTIGQEDRFFIDGNAEYVLMSITDEGTSKHVNQFLSHPLPSWTQGKGQRYLLTAVDEHGNSTLENGFPRQVVVRRFKECETFLWPHYSQRLKVAPKSLPRTFQKLPDTIQTKNGRSRKPTLALYGKRIKAGKGGESIGSEEGSSANNNLPAAQAPLFGRYDTTEWDTYMAGVLELERTIDGEAGGQGLDTSQDLDSFMNEEFGQD